jgi:hypothetical protein
VALTQKGHVNDWAAEMPPFLFQVVPAPQRHLAFSIRIIVANFESEMPVYGFDSDI